MLRDCLEEPKKWRQTWQARKGGPGLGFRDLGFRVPGSSRREPKTLLIKEDIAFNHKDEAPLWFRDAPNV